MAKRYADIAFQVSAGTYHQVIEILHPDFDAETIVEGLKSGSLIATTQTDDYIYVAHSDLCVAKIVSSADSGLELDNFRVIRKDYHLKSEGIVSHIVPVEGKNE